MLVKYIFHRRVLGDPTCEACGVAAESSGHFFWDCDKASEIWKLSGIPFDTQGAHLQDLKDLLWHIMFVQWVPPKPPWYDKY